MDYDRFKTKMLRDSKDVGARYLTRNLTWASRTVPDVISLCAGMPDASSYPFSKFMFKLKDGTELAVEEDELQKLMPYQSNRGLPKLIEWVRSLHKQYHDPPKLGARVDGSEMDVCITQGAATGLFFLFQMFVDVGDVVLVEDYSFSATRIKITMRGGECHPVYTDEAGIVPEKLREVLEGWNDTMKKRPQLLVTNPNGQNPTGTIMPMDRKRQVYQIAQEFDLLIIEDDPYYYLQYTDELCGSYQSIDADGRVLRIDSTSKIIAPSLRLGWITGASSIIAGIAEQQMLIAMACSSASMVIGLKLFDHWQLEGFAHRIDHLQQLYKRRRDLIEASVTKWLKGLVEWQTPQAGIFMWLKVIGSADTMFLANISDASRHKIFCVPGFEFQCDSTTPSQYVRLCFSKIDEREIDEGMRRLSIFLREKTSDCANDT